MVRVENHEDRTVRYMEKQDDRKRRKLRKPLDIEEKVLVIAERLKKKDALGILHKSSTKNKPFFNRNEVFKINKIKKLELIGAKQIIIGLKKTEKE